MRVPLHRTLTWSTSDALSDAKAYTYGEGCVSHKKVKLFKNGRNQAVRIPREFELPGDHAVMRKEGHRLIIESVQPKSLLAVLAGLRPIDETFPPIRDSPVAPDDL